MYNLVLGIPHARPVRVGVEAGELQKKLGLLKRPFPSKRLF